jgi:two-component system chemotaxis response regulator CheY
MSKKCLIIDDVEVSRYVIGSHMEELGFSITEADNLEKAEEILSKNQFDLILLDWHLRQENKLSDAIPKLKKSMGSRHSPIVVCSGVEQGNLVSKVKEMGGQGFIAKPSTLEGIRSELRNIGII